MYRLVLCVCVCRGVGVGASLVVQKIKNLPAMRKTWVRSLGSEEPLEEGMATHSSILDRRIPWIEEPGAMVHSVANRQTGLNRLGTRAHMGFLKEVKWTGSYFPALLHFFFYGTYHPDLYLLICCLSLPPGCKLQESKDVKLILFILNPQGLTVPGTY